MMTDIADIEVHHWRGRACDGRPVLTKVPNIGPSTGHQDAISKAVWDPKYLTDYPRHRDADRFIQQCNEDERAWRELR